MVRTTHARRTDATGVFSTSRITRQEVAARNRCGRVPASRRVGVLRRRSPAEPRPVAARVRHCLPPEILLLTQSMVIAQRCRSRSAGLGRPRTYGARHALRSHRCTGAENGRSDSRGEFRPCDPRRSDNHRRISAPGKCRTHASVLAGGGRAKREFERSTFSGSRKSASAGQGRRCVGSRGVVRISYFR